MLAKRQLTMSVWNTATLSAPSSVQQNTQFFLPIGMQRRVPLQMIGVNIHGWVIQVDPHFRLPLLVVAQGFTPVGMCFFVRTLLSVAMIPRMVPVSVYWEDPSHKESLAEAGRVFNRYEPVETALVALSLITD